MKKNFNIGEIRLQDWIEAIPEPAVLLDEAGEAIFANAAADNLLGNPMGKAVADWNIAFDTSIIDMIASRNYECNAKCGDEEITARLRLINGNTSHYLLTLLSSEQVIQSGTDEEFKLKKAIEIRTRLLKVADEKYRNLYADSSFGIIQLDPNGDWMSANPTFLQMSGRLEETLPDERFENLIYPEDRDDLEMTMQDWFAGAKRDHTCRLYHPDGMPRHISIWPKIMKNDGKVEGLQLSIMDVSEATEARLAAEQEKQRAVDSLESIIESMLESMAVLEPNGRISRVNKAMINLLGYREDELLGKPIGTLFAGDEEKISEQTRKFANLLKMPTGSEVDLVWRSKDGSIIPVAFTASVMRDPSGHLTGILGIARDQRENRLMLKFEEANKKLESTLDELKAVDAAKDDLIAMVGHELRGPLTAIRGFSELVCAEKVAEDKRIEYGNIIVSEIDRLTRMVNDILDLAKLEAGKLHFNMEPVLIKDTIENCVNRANIVAGKRNVTITTFYEESSQVVMDPDRIKQVVDNILSNAVKFSPDNGEINVTTTDHKYYLKIAVEDHGLGIPENQKDAVFTKFEQTPDGRQMVGTGLGMPISRSIVEDGHRGRIWFESEGEGKGTVFFFTVPKNLEPTDL